MLKGIKDFFVFVMDAGKEEFLSENAGIVFIGRRNLLIGGGDSREGIEWKF